MVPITSGEGAPIDQPFPDLYTLSKDPGLTAAAPAILGGKSGFAGWSVGNTLYRTHYETIEIAPGFKTATSEAKASGEALKFWVLKAGSVLVTPSSKK